MRLPLRSEGTFGAGLASQPFPRLGRGEDRCDPDAPATKSLNARAPLQEVVFRELKVFERTSDTPTGPASVVVRGNLIVAIGRQVAPQAVNAANIEGRERTLRSRPIDLHVHMMFNSLSPA